MSPRLTLSGATAGGLDAALAAEIGDNIEADEARMARVHTEAMRTVVGRYKDRLRADIISGGFYAAVKLSKTWQGRVYPAGSRASMEPAGFLSTNASTIIDAFTLGATITVRNATYLAVPEGPAKAIVRQLNQAKNRSRDASGQFADEEGTVARVAAALGVERLEAHIDARTGRGVLVAAGAKLTRAGKRSARQSGPDTVLFALVKQATLKQRIQGRSLLQSFDASALGDFESAVTAQLSQGER